MLTCLHFCVCLPVSDKEQTPYFSPELIFPCALHSLLHIFLLHSVLGITQGAQTAFAWPCCLFSSIYCFSFAVRHLNFLFPHGPLAWQSSFLFLSHYWNCILKSQQCCPWSPIQGGLCFSFILLILSEALIFFSPILMYFCGLCLFTYCRIGFSKLVHCIASWLSISVAGF
jgi:hypothetical protein